MGTMPHSLIIIFGDQIKAWKAFDEVMSDDVPRVALIDTYFDEKTEAILAANALNNSLNGVRLDTPSSRKGNLEEIVREVRWELDIRGHEDVKIFVSGGLDEENIEALRHSGASGFGVGTSISNAPTIDFAMDIVEIEGKPSAKRGKLGGTKQVMRCPKCMIDVVTFKEKPSCPNCEGPTDSILKLLLKNGEIVGKLPKIDEIRKYVLKQISNQDLC